MGRQICILSSSNDNGQVNRLLSFKIVIVYVPYTFLLFLGKIKGIIYSKTNIKHFNKLSLFIKLKKSDFFLMLF